MLPTGLAELDRKHRGGVPTGSIVVLTAPPDIQSEFLLEQVARVNDSTYGTTLRDEATLAERLPEAAVTRTTSAPLLSDQESYLDVPRVAASSSTR